MNNALMAPKKINVARPAKLSLRQLSININLLLLKICRMPSGIFSVQCLRLCFRVKWIVTSAMNLTITDTKIHLTEEMVIHTKNFVHLWGEVEIDAPRDRDGSFDPQLMPKRSKDVSGIEDKVLAMYAKGMSQRDIADTIEDIYGFDISHETISNITDQVIETANEWQNRPLKKFYTFLFVDCLYVNIRKDMETKSCAVYVVLGYDVNGIKDILGIWIGDAEGKHYWMQIFDEIKNRGVEDILFISMDGVSGLEEGAKSIFKDVVVQRCIVHLIRNSIKYIPSKDYKAYTAQLKKYMELPA